MLHVLRLQPKKRVQQADRPTHVMAVALQLGDDAPLTLDDAFAADDGRLGLRQMLLPLRWVTARR